jgi:hypothetical protein
LDGRCDVVERKKGKRGPKTVAGRRAVRLNPVKHGVLSQTPVIALVEKQEDWERLREGTFEYFQVEGIVEEGLADQIAMLMWRRYRLVRFETESIAGYLDEVPEDYERMRGALRDGPSTAAEAALRVNSPPDALMEEKAIAEMDRMLSARLLPGSEVMEKVMRYETRIHRFLLQSIHQLLVLQALRQSRGSPDRVLGRGRKTEIAGDDENLGRMRPSRPRSLRPTETARGGVVGLPGTSSK